MYMTQDARMRSTRPAATIVIIVRKFALIARPTYVDPVVCNGYNRQDDIGHFPSHGALFCLLIDNTA
jgi:hypothetical protein